MSKPKKSQHIIPKCYLKAFKSMNQNNGDAYRSKKGQENVLIYKKNKSKWKQKGYGKDSIFTKKYYYDLKIDEGFEDSKQFIENYFNRYEQKYPETLNKLIVEDYDNITDDEIFCFIHFLYLMTVRNEDFLKNAEEMFDKINKTISDMYRKSGLPVDKNNLIPSYSGPRIAIADEKFKITLKLMNNGFIIIDNNTKIPFITSDKTFASTQSEFIFILSPNNAICFPKEEEILHSRMEVQEDFVIKLNKAVYDFASKYIISNIELKKEYFIPEKKSFNFKIYNKKNAIYLDLKKATTDSKGFISLHFNKDSKFKDIEQLNDDFVSIDFLKNKDEVIRLNKLSIVKITEEDFEVILILDEVTRKLLGVDLKEEGINYNK